MSRAGMEAWQACEKQKDKRIALAKREADELAMAIWRDYYKDESPNFELCDSTAGVISQIDNMYAGLREKYKKLEAQNKELRKVLKDERESANDLTKSIVEKVRLIKELVEALTRIANIALHGSLIGFSDTHKAMNEIRKLSLSYWDEDECAKIQKP